MKAKIGIRATIDGRWGGVRESLEQQTTEMALAAKQLIEANCFYSDGSPVECVVGSTTIGGGAEAYIVEQEFAKSNVCASLTVTPCWCYGLETMDMNPTRIKAIWGFNGTERPGAVYLAAAMAAHAQRGLPAFAIYGKDVCDIGDIGITDDVKQKIICFAQCAVAVGQIKDKAYVGIGSVSMGIAGSYTDADFFQKYLGMRCEWVDMVEILRREELGIYDKDEYDKAIEWTRKNCIEGYDKNDAAKAHSREQKDKDWEFSVKMTLIIKDILLGNPKLNNIGRHEEAMGRNAVLGGFQGQRMWTDYKPNADFSEAILNSSFDWNGKREPITLATENDGLNGLSMLFLKLLTGTASVFADVRTYWSPASVQRITGYTPVGKASEGFIHLINSGAAALDGTGMQKDANGGSIIKKWWQVNENDIAACLAAVRFCPADLSYFRGGGFSSQFNTSGEMPVTMLRINLIDGLGPVMQIAEGYTVDLPKDVNDTLLNRTDPTWPSTWFVPRLNGKGAFTSVYSVMANWGANHGAFAYGHIAEELITLASMLRIPVSMHNSAAEPFRPHSFAAFGTQDSESADYRACAAYGALYK